MIVHHINHKGMFSDGQVDGSSSIEIDNLSNTNKSIVAVSPVGVVQNVSIAEKTRYEYYEHSSTIQTFNVTSSQVFIDGSNDIVTGGLNTWNTASGIFQPEEIGRVYTIRYEGLVEPIGGNPILNMDFVVSGTFSGSLIVWGRHHQSVETLIRNAVNHQHVHAVYTVIVDEQLFTSGGLIQAGVTAGTINIVSSSILIKEG